LFSHFVLIFSGKLSAPTITTTTTTEDKSKEKGARVQKLSFIYKMALVDAHLVMDVSERKLSHGQALLIYATLRELKEQGLVKEDVSLETVETST